jgi:hypothetical protein
MVGFFFFIQLTYNSMNTDRKKLKQLYSVAKSAKVGEYVVCPSCQIGYFKKRTQQAFCGTWGTTVCKDNYWNNVTPTKRNNTTRISPANDAFQAKHGLGEHRDLEGSFDPDDDPSWDAHKHD